MTHHGQLYLRDIVPPRSKYYNRGRYGRLFPTLPPFAVDTERVRDALLNIGKQGGVMDPGAAANQDNPNIPAGFTFLGQFLDHDITFDPTSSLERQSDPESIENFRTPAFELDSVYASGRAASPHLYDSATGNLKLLIDAEGPNDLPRNSQNTALIGDPRNDENLIVSQLQLAFVKFHNAMVDKLSEDGVERAKIFEEAQRLVRWHYQWIILHEFLPLTVGPKLIKDVLDKQRKFYDWNHEPFIPVEFSVAAYRFGHSQIRPVYRVNSQFVAPVFDPSELGKPDPNDLSGGKRAPRRFVEWQNLFHVGANPPQFSKRIDTVLSGPLFQLPFVAPNLPTNPSSLAQRNLLRHLTFSLPSGQRVARAMRVRPLARADLADIAPFDTETPLWFYILREADKREGGSLLGPVGGRIVAEVFIGLLQGDRLSYLRQDPEWKPILGVNGEFKMADLLKFAGVA